MDWNLDWYEVWGTRINLILELAQFLFPPKEKLARKYILICIHLIWQMPRFDWSKGSGVWSTDGFVDFETAFREAQDRVPGNRISQKKNPWDPHFHYPFWSWWLVSCWDNPRCTIHATAWTDLFGANIGHLQLHPAQIPCWFLPVYAQHPDEIVLHRQSHRCQQKMHPPKMLQSLEKREWSFGVQCPSYEGSRRLKLCIEIRA